MIIKWRNKNDHVCFFEFRVKAIHAVLKHAWLFPHRQVSQPIQGCTRSKAASKRKTVCPLSVAPRINSSASGTDVPVLFCLYLDGTTRYNELKRKLAPATYKSLTSALRGLVADGLVKRVEYPQVPPKVEYSLTERGLSLMPVLDELCLWGEAHRDDRVPSSDW